jgi:hypothetical protein
MDARGRPVRDLSAADFVLYEDNRVQPLVIFAPPLRVGDESRSSRPLGPMPVASPAVPQREPVTFVVYVDNWNLTPEDRARVLPGVALFLKEQLAQGGARALVVSAGEETHLLSPLTSDAETVVAALRSAQQEPAHGHITRSDERQAIETVKALLEGPAGCEDITLLQAPIRVQAQARSRELQDTLARLEAVTQALGTLPGRRTSRPASGSSRRRRVARPSSTPMTCGSPWRGSPTRSGASTRWASRRTTRRRVGAMACASSCVERACASATRLLTSTASAPSPA